jgi:hypothetical protein
VTPSPRSSEKVTKKAYQMFLPKTTLPKYERKVVTAKMLCTEIVLDSHGRNSRASTRMMLPWTLLVWHNLSQNPWFGHGFY